MSTREVIIAVLIVSLGATGTAWFLANFEQVTEKVRVGFRGEARRNPWLAAQRLLERMDLPASELREFEPLRNLAPDAVLVLPARRQTISEPIRQRLMNWVRSGGVLIVEAEYPSVADPLVSGLGVERVKNAGDQSNDATEYKTRNTGNEREESGRTAFDIYENSPELTVVQFPGSTLSSLLWMEARFSLVSEHAWFRAGTEHASSILLLREGNGVVAVLNDLDFATNSEIGDLDHAQFIVELARFAQKSGPVIFFNNPGQPSLMKWLRTHAWAPILAAILALLLWLWKVVPRSGPVAPDPGRERRRLLDHLRASGRVVWAKGQGARLLEASR
jgi:hypothetical protein